MTNAKYDFKDLLENLDEYIKNGGGYIYAESLTAIEFLLEKNTELVKESENLKHDVNSYMKISNEVATENETLKQAITRMDNDINNAHKDLVKVHDILSYGNSCDFEEDIAAALRITVKYID